MIRPDEVVADEDCEGERVKSADAERENADKSQTRTSSRVAFPRPNVAVKEEKRERE